MGARKIHNYFIKLIFIAVTLSVSVSVHAQVTQLTSNYPSKPVRLIVPNTPGGGIDITARLVAQKLAERFGRPFVVDNRAGAGGIIAMELVARANPDGYTLLVGTGTTMATATALKKVDFDTRNAYVPVVEMISQPYLLTVAPAFPVATVKELIAYAKSRPGTINYASSGVGSGSHMGLELFKYTAGVDMVHVPYKGLAPAMIDVTGGQIQLLFGAAITLAPFVKSGRLKALAVGSARRSPSYPDLPTIAESGLPGFERSNSYSLFATAATPAAVVASVNREVGAIFKLPEVQDKLAAEGAEAAAPNSPAEFKAKYAAEVAVWEKFFKTTGIKF